MHELSLTIGSSETTNLYIETKNIEIQQKHFNIQQGDTLTLTIKIPQEPFEILEYKLLQGLKIDPKI